MRMQPFIIALSVLSPCCSRWRRNSRSLQRLAGTVEELAHIVRHFDEESLRSG
jgi:hypothetical protein